VGCKNYNRPGRDSLYYFISGNIYVPQYLIFIVHENGIMITPDLLDLILSLEDSSDQLVDENDLAVRLTDQISQGVHADLGILALPDPDHHRHYDVRALVDHREILSHLGAGQTQDWLAQADAAAENFLHFAFPAAAGSLYVAALALRQKEPAAGIVLLGRLDEDFSVEEISLLRTACRQAEGALRVASLYRRLQHERLALHTILKMDRIRDTSNSLDELLDRALGEVCRVIPSEAGFVMLYDRQGRRLELRAVTVAGFFDSADAFERLSSAADEAIHSAKLIHRDYKSGPLIGLLAIPMILNQRVIGVLGVVNRKGSADFTAGDRQVIHAIGSQMDTAIFEQMQTQRLRDTFGRRVGPQVMERLLRIDDRDLLKGERREMTALFSDIRNFTGVSENLDPGQIEEMINLHLQAMTRVVLENEGTLDKFMGDGIMALFNIPEAQADFSLRAVQTALEMQRAHQEVMLKWAEKGLPAQPIGIGIATGIAISGNFGSSEHAEYSVIGSSVNLAARLCASAGGGEILADARTIQLAGPALIARALQPQIYKGFSQPVPTWQVTGLRV
jgi:class 3 adenylate cyclase